MPPRSWTRAPRSRVRNRWPVATALALIGCALLIGWALRWYRPALPAVVVVFTGDADVDPAPHGIWHTIGEPTSLDRGSLESLSTRLAGPRHQAAVVIVAAAGARVTDGPMIFAERDVVPVREILAELGKLPAGKPKFLLFDATAAEAYPDHGFAHNGFTAGLQSLTPEFDQVPNLVVLSASGVGERSTISAESRGSAFAISVTRGLQGDADDNRDGRVTTAELLQHVQQATSDWVRLHRGGVQTPWVYPGTVRGDVALALNVTRPPPIPPAPFEPPAGLTQAWTDSPHSCRGSAAGVVRAAGLESAQTGATRLGTASCSRRSVRGGSVCGGSASVSSRDRDGASAATRRRRRSVAVGGTRCRSDIH